MVADFCTLSTVMLCVINLAVINLQNVYCNILCQFQFILVVTLAIECLFN
jgi:hypothetical protein